MTCRDRALGKVLKQVDDMHVWQVETCIESTLVSKHSAANLALVHALHSKEYAHMHIRHAEWDSVKTHSLWLRSAP